MANKIKNLAFFASGSGSNVMAILENINKGIIDANPAVLITNNSNAGVVDKVKKFVIPFYHISSVTHPEDEKRIEHMMNVLEKFETDLIILAGYMKKLPDKIIENYKNRILNIHPALLPKFGGKNMYGMNVHKAVINSDETESGATVHIVSSEYDKGKILAQKKVGIENNDTPETLQKKVLNIEHQLYSHVISEIISGNIDLQL